MNDLNRTRMWLALPALLLGWAGVSKFVNPDAIMASLKFVFTMLGLTNTPLIESATALACVEILLAVLLIQNPRNRFVLASCIAFLALLTLVLVWFVVVKGAPSCGCLGSRLPGKFTNSVGILRNVGMIGLVMWAYRESGKCLPRSQMQQITQQVLSGASRAFSLIEVLVVIAVVGVLIAIILPALAHSRSQAQQLRTLSVLHQLSLAMMSYTDDHQDHFPFTAMPEKPWLGVVLPGLPYSVSYFGGQSATYANLLVPHYFPDRAIIDFPGEYGARSRAAQSFMTPYLLTYGAFAPNVYWQGESAPDDLSLYQSAPRYSCTFPVNKAMLMHSLSGMYAPHKSSTQLLVVGTRMDGSGITVVLPGDYQDRLADRPYGCQPMPFLATQGGLGGRDF